MFAQIKLNQQVLLAEIFSFLDQQKKRIIFLVETVDGRSMFAEKDTVSGAWKPWFADGIEPDTQLGVCRFIDKMPIDDLVFSAILLPERA